MKKILITALLLPCLVHGQEKDKGSANHLLYVTAGVQGYNCYNPNVVLGLGYERALKQNWNLNYRVDVGRYYFHIPLGLPLGVVLYALIYAKGKDDFPEVMLLASMIPEGAGYTIKLTPNLLLTPYINPLGLDYIKWPDCPPAPEGEEKSELQAMASFGCSLGIRLSEKMILSGFSEYRTSWLGRRYGLQSGIRLGHKVNF